MANDSILDIKDILNEYSRDIQNGIVETAKRVAKDGAKDLKETKNAYNVRKGAKYNKGWGVSVEQGRMSINCYIHNKKNAGLTHLLEEGHAWVGRDGTRKDNAAKPHPHIKQVEERVKKEYDIEVIKVIQNGG